DTPDAAAGEGADVSQTERTELTPRPTASTLPGAPTASVPRPVAERSADEIERDIEVTRDRLAEAIDELSERRHPKAIAHRAADKAKLTVIDERGQPRTNRVAAIAGTVAAIAAIVIWRRRR